MSLQSKIARAVAKEIKLTLSPEEELKLSSNKKIIPEAHKAYLKGKHFWNKRTADDILKALEFYKSAVEADPTYALAYIGEAESYSLLHEYAGFPSKDTYPKAIDWLETGYEERDFAMTALNSNPQYQAPELLKNKRYQAILKKMNFPNFPDN